MGDNLIQCKTEGSPHGGQQPIAACPSAFAFTGLVNSDSGNGLLTDLSYGNWLLERFAGLHNPPAVPQTLSAAQLAPYEGRYAAREIDPPPGDSAETSLVIRAVNGGLGVRRVPESGNAVPEF